MVLAIGWTEVAHRQPAWKRQRPTVAPPIRINSSRPLGNSRTSSGFPKFVAVVGGTRSGPARRAEENSPAIHRWGRAGQGWSSPGGTTEPVRPVPWGTPISFVPAGLCAGGDRPPSDESLGYSRASLRDFHPPSSGLGEAVGFAGSDGIPPKTAKNLLFPCVAFWFLVHGCSRRAVA